MRTFKYLSAILFFIALASCGGGSSSGGTATTPTISGTAASGTAIANAQITITGAAGGTVTVTTGSDGSYNADVSSLTPPYLVKVVTGGATTNYPAGTTFYSVGTATGTVNIHPLTDLIVRTWYAVQGTDADTAFADPASNPPPTANEVGVIKQVVKNMVAQFLDFLANVDSTSFDLISTPFIANSIGFDNFLDNISLTPGSGEIFINAASGVAPEYEATLAVSGVDMTSTLAQDLGNTGTFTEVSTATNTLSGITTSPYAGTWSVGHTTTSSNGNCGTQTLNVPQPAFTIVVDSNGNFLLPDLDNAGHLTGYIQGAGHISANGDLTAILYGDTVAPYIGGTCPAGTITATMTDVNNGSGTFSQDGGGTVTLTRVTTPTAVSQFDGTYALSYSTTRTGGAVQKGTFTVIAANGVLSSTIPGAGTAGADLILSGTVSASGVVSIGPANSACALSLTGQATITSTGDAEMTGTLSEPVSGTCDGSSGTWAATRISTATGVSVFNGTYTGSDSGILEPPCTPGCTDSFLVQFTVDNGVVTSVDNTTGTVSASGDINFMGGSTCGSSDGSVVPYNTMTGHITISTTGVATATGTSSAPQVGTGTQYGCNARTGTWTASRQ